MSLNLGIVDKDKEYIIGLAEYINRQKDAHIYAKAFTSYNYLEEYTAHSVLDIVLVGDTEEFCHRVLPSIYLCEDKDMCKKKDYIYKYQNLKDIVKLIQDYSKGKIKKDYKTSDVYAVFSPLGRCGKTSFAKALTYSYGDGLYLGFEEYLPCREDNYKEEYSYYLSEEHPKLFEDIDSLLCDDRGCRYVHLMGNYMDAVCIGFCQLQWLIEGLIETMNYKALVFDFGGAMIFDYKMFELFDYIYIPVIEDEISRFKLEDFRYKLQRWGLEHIIKKIKYIVVPVEKPLNIESIISKEIM